MRIPYPAKPLAITPKVRGRFAFDTARYVPHVPGLDRGAIVTTDGRALAAVGVSTFDGDGFNGKAVTIPADVAKLASSRAEPSVVVSDDGFTVGRTTYADDDERSNWPDVEAVVRDCNPANPPDGIQVRINAKLLAKLAQAIGTECVRLTFAKPRADDAQIVHAVLVEPMYHERKAPATEHAFGIIMPIAS